MIGSEDVTRRFDSETAYVFDPENEPIGEVIPPGEQAGDGFDFDASVFLTDELVGLIFAMPGMAMARKTGHQFWEPSEEELSLLGKAAGPGVRFLAQKYLNGAMGPWGLIGASMGIVYGPKLVMEVMEQQKEKKQSSPRPAATQPAATRFTDESPASWDKPEVESQQSSSDYSVPYPG